jgi:hypothetical protein
MSSQCYRTRSNSTHPEQSTKLEIEYLRTSHQRLKFPFVQLSVCEAYRKRSADMSEDSELMILFGKKKK